ncbi:MAG: coproporphyrinogen-III oxidase family protein [Bacteroidales bacterium]
MAGVYIHIPFCEQFCTYCNFYSVKGGAYRGKFIQALKREIEIKKDLVRGAATIYFGGGTPSVLPAEQLREILQTVLACDKESLNHICNSEDTLLSRDTPRLSRDTFTDVSREITLEVNPDDITPAYARTLVESGFNRVSMGVQSFIDDHLAWMNRRHRAAHAVEAFHTLRSAGFRNISLDLIFGYSLLSMEQWQYNLQQIIELAPNHISAYQMSVEPGSALSAKLQKREYNLPSDQFCWEQYRMLQQMLEAGGYEQYEISSFARKGFYSRHNRAYWNKTPYVGLGPAAHSYDGGLRRFWNTASVKKYCDFYNENDSSDFSAVGVCDSEILSAEDVFNESVMLGLRTVEGFDVSNVDPALLNQIHSAVEKEILLGNLIANDSALQIPRDKLFISDSIIRELMV